MGWAWEHRLLLVKEFIEVIFTNLWTGKWLGSEIRDAVLGEGGSFLLGESSGSADSK